MPLDVLGRARYTDVFNEFTPWRQAGGRRSRNKVSVGEPAEGSLSYPGNRTTESDETPLSVGGLLADSVPADFRGYVFRPESVNHRVFERKLRPKPSGRGTSAWVSQIVVPHPLEDMGRKLVSVCYRTRLAKIRAKGARSVSTCGGEFKPRNIVGRSVQKLSMTQSPQRDPRSVLSDGPGPSSLERGAREVRARRARTLSHHEALSTSRVVWECSPNRAVNSVKAKYGRETDGEQVPRGKDEKDFEKRVKECLKLSGGSGWGRRCVPVGCGTEQSGPPIDSGRGPTRIKAVA
ncbi:hypothetical protein Bca101_101926 [Brassica carinata]